MYAASVDGLLVPYCFPTLGFCLVVGVLVLFYSRVSLSLLGMTILCFMLRS